MMGDEEVAVTTLNEVVDELLRTFVAALRDRSVDRALACFTTDAVLVGSAPGEVAIGPDLAAFFASVFDNPRTVGWEWGELLGRLEGPTAWFVTEGSLVLVEDDGRQASSPYRISGVLRFDQRWRFALFNGTAPI